MRRAYAKQAAASGIDFVAVIAAIGIIERWKHLNTPGEIAVNASQNIFATVTLLYGVAAVFLFWFVSTLSARMRQLEGGSGRLASAVNTSGAIIAGILAIGLGAMWAAHSTTSTDSAALATSLLDGPTVFFPAAVLVGASGVIGTRARGLPVYSRVVSRLSLPLALAFIGGGGLILFKDYAWINDTGNIVFGVWILILSIIGIVRWTDLDETGDAPVVKDEPDAAPTPREQPASRKPREVPAPRPARKPRQVRKFAPRTADLPRVEPPVAEAEDEEEVTVPAPRRAPRKRPAARKFAPRATDLARENRPRLEDEDEPEPEPDEDEPEDDDDEQDEREEFEHGGPPRRKPRGVVTPARRPGASRREAKEPAPRKTVARKPAAPRAAPPKPSPRKPSVARKFAPRAPRRGGDATEIIEPDEE